MLCLTKDDRLYGRFTLDFADSPKIAPLSDSAFRTLVEMTLYSRRMLSDGFVDRRIASKKWKTKSIVELLANDVTKPSLSEVDGGYQIHDYAEHQQTRADIEKKRTAGSMGGRASAQARASADAQPSSKLTTETETETETESSSSTKKNEAAKRGTRIHSNFAISDEMRTWALVNTPHIDIDVKLPEFIDYWSGVPGEKGVKLDWVAAWRNGMRKQEQWAVKDNPAVAQPPKKRFTAHVD